MNKKSAIATAGGLVASFAAGVAAVSLNWGIGTGAATSAAATSPVPSPSASPKAMKLKPIIRHRTITIHKKPHRSKPSGSGFVTLAAPSSSSFAPTATSSGSHGASSEHEGG